MTSRQQWGIVGAVLLVLGIGLAIASYSMKDELYPVFVGSKMPNFRAKELGSSK